MAKTISTFKSELQRKLRGTSLARVADANSTIGEAAGNVLAQIDPLETLRTAQITNAVHDNVFDYAAPSDLKGNKVVDIRPQVSRTVADNTSQRYLQEFDLRKEVIDDIFTINYNNGTKSLRFSKNISPAPTTIHAANDITANGTWAVGDDATNLTKDTLNFISGGASLNFDLDGSTTTGYIENSTMTQVDLSDEDEIGTIFMWVYLPNASAVTNVILRWGNDSSNYWSRTVTAPHFGSFQNGWNLCSFAWNGATETGTVAPATIDYLRVTITYDGTADTDFRVDNIVVSNGEIWEIVYYSKHLFQDTSGTYLEAPTSDTDTINLDTDSYNILLYETAMLVTQEVGGEDAANDFQWLFTQLHGKGNIKGLYKLYKQSNLSQTSKARSIYYRV